MMKFIALRIADRIGCVSLELARELGIPSEKVNLIQNVVSLSEIREPDCNPPTSENDWLQIVMVSRFVPVKCIELPIDVLERLLNEHNRNVHLSLVGNGVLQEKLQRMVEERKLDKHITFLGFRENATDYINSANLFLMTSESEGVPTVLLEAIVRGVPFVTTRVGGIPETVALLSGYPCIQVEFQSDERNTVNGLVDAILQLFPPGATTHIRADQSIVMRARSLFDLENAFKSWIPIFGQLCPQCLPSDSCGQNEISSGILDEQ